MRMLRVLIVSLVFLLELAFVIIFVDADGGRHRIDAERRAVAAVMGWQTDELLVRRSNQVFTSLFIRSGAVETSYSRLLPQPGDNSRGQLNLAPWAFRWLRHRIDAFWIVAWQAIYRSQIMLIWWPLAALLSSVALIDGSVERQVRRCEYRLSSNDQYTLARRVLLILTFAPCFYVFAPLHVGAYCIPVGIGVIAFATWLTAAHAQHEL